jgi:hypothetical protein
MIVEGLYDATFEDRHSGRTASIAVVPDSRILTPGSHLGEWTRDWQEDWTEDYGVEVVGDLNELVPDASLVAWVGGILQNPGNTGRVQVTAQLIADAERRGVFAWDAWETPEVRDFAHYLTSEPIIPSLQSPLMGATLEGLAAKGAAISLGVAAYAHDPLLLLYVPGAIILVKTAGHVGDAVGLGLRHKILGWFGAPEQPPPRGLPRRERPKSLTAEGHAVRPSTSASSCCGGARKAEGIWRWECGSERVEPPRLVDQALPCGPGAMLAL